MYSAPGYFLNRRPSFGDAALAGEMEGFTKFLIGNKRIHTPSDVEYVTKLATAFYNNNQ